MQLSRRLACALVGVMAASVIMRPSLGCAQEAAPGDLRVALQGFDPVAYFTEGAPRQGSPDLWAIFDGTIYHFASNAHRDLFMSDPDHYAPQYAGFCTGAVAMGMSKVEADPRAWVITEGRLFVFFARSDVADFERAKPAMIRSADANWEKMRAAH